jgi:replicative DNA helicase
MAKATAQTPTEIPPPHSLESEQAVLGSILLDEQALVAVEGTLEPDHFHHERHRHIYAALEHLITHGRPVDLLTLSNELKGRELLEAVGGTAYLASLEQAVVHPENIAFHAKIVRDKWRLRNLITMGRLVVSLGEGEGEEADEIIDKAEQRLFEIQRDTARKDFQPIGDVVHRTMDEIDRAQSEGKPLTGVPTGYEDLDGLTLGLHPSDLLILAARPAMGKTAFALNVALNVAMKAEVGVGLFSLEMSADQLTTRMLCTLAELPSTLTRSGRMSRTDVTRLDKEAAKLSQLPIFIDDTPGQTASEIRAKARRLCMREPDVGVIIIDYLQLMSGPTELKSRQEQISAITRSLKALARDLHLPVIALSQLSRKVEERKGRDRRPILSDLRESGAIEQDADIVMFLHRDDYFEKERDPDFDSTQPSVTDLIIAKHRNGPTDTIQLLFFRQHTKFMTLLNE